MTTVVPGLLKIGRTETNRYKERMRNLEKNGYNNTTGLKRRFAIELDDYIDKEKLIHEIFSKHRVDDSELFALDEDLAAQLFLTLDGRVVYPEHADKERVFDEVTERRKRGPLFGFYAKGMTDGDIITFIDDDAIMATVASDRDVEYDGETLKLATLTRKIFEQKGAGNESGRYQGAAYWAYRGTKLKDLPDINRSDD